jgi:hypothetical protein
MTAIKVDLVQPTSKDQENNRFHGEEATTEHTG